MPMPRVHQCEFCRASFSPRPQVKRPRACPQPNCQDARQKANEQAWRQRNPGVFDGKYHDLMRKLRTSRIEVIAREVSLALDLGARLLGKGFDAANAIVILVRIFSDLGVRAANKLWPAEKTCAALT